MRCFFLEDLEIEFPFDCWYPSGSGGVVTGAGQTTMKVCGQRVCEKRADLAIEFSELGESFIAASRSGKGGVPRTSPSAISGLGGAMRELVFGDAPRKSSFTALAMRQRADIYSRECKNIHIL